MSKPQWLKDKEIEEVIERGRKHLDKVLKGNKKCSDEGIVRHLREESKKYVQS